MSVFVVFCAAMALVAITVVVYPLLRPVPVSRKGEAPSPKATPVALVVALALPVAAALIYSGITSFPWSNPATAAAVPPGHGIGGDAGSMAEVTTALEKRLAENPADAEGWRMLGRTYLVTGKAGQAVVAYEKAAKLLPERNAELELDIAEAMVLSDDAALQPRARELVDAALAADGSNQKALWYSGVIAVRGGDEATARTNWQKLLEQNPPPEIRQLIASQLAELGVVVPPAAGAPAMSGPMMTGPAGNTAATPAGRTIRVAVSIDPSIASKIKPGVPLFVSARQPGIPGPPLAAVRLTSDELPTTVTLSDANSMIEGRNLSSVDDVEVVARVAFGGTAITASGDLIGSAVQKKGAASEMGVVISKIQP
jgi:cytochrome c-type biogenesis protein CcmH